MSQAHFGSTVPGKKVKRSLEVLFPEKKVKRILEVLFPEKKVKRSLEVLFPEKKSSAFWKYCSRKNARLVRASARALTLAQFYLFLFLFFRG
jgi:hypothetical protein